MGCRVGDISAVIVIVIAIVVDDSGYLTGTAGCFEIAETIRSPTSASIRLHPPGYFGLYVSPSKNRMNNALELICHEMR